MRLVRKHGQLDMHMKDQWKQECIKKKMKMEAFFCSGIILGWYVVCMHVSITRNVCYLYRDSVRVIG